MTVLVGGQNCGRCGIARVGGARANLYEEYSPGPQHRHQFGLATGATQPDTAHRNLRSVSIACAVLWATTVTAGSANRIGESRVTPVTLS